MDFTELFCSVDDFFIDFSKTCNLFIQNKKKKPGTKSKLSLSEIVTILIAYHQSSFRHFKAFYLFLSNEKLHDFPNLVSYHRFVELTKNALPYLSAYLQSKMGSVTGISFIDSNSIAICKNIRISRNRVFSGLAKRGKSSCGWFFGFKLHLIVNEIGELLSVKVTQGNVDDRNPVLNLCKKIKGKIFADRGYLGDALFKKLYKKGIHLITSVKGNMKNKIIPMVDKIMLRKRFIIETINDQLKNISNIEHSRHRSPTNFMVNLLGGLIAYALQPHKPSIKIPYPFLALK